jgi:hypothetical protein
MKNWVYFDSGAVDLNQVIGVKSISEVLNSGSRVPAIEFILKKKKSLCINFLSETTRDNELKRVKTLIQNLS